jgi:spermidine/putrescine transport system substrate-binding protein
MPASDEAGEEVDMDDRLSLSRRRLLQLTGVAGASAFLATSRVTAQSSGSAAQAGLANSGVFRMASWIGYMPTDESGTTYPDLDRFTTETGVGIDYSESIEDNEGFYASDLRPPLEAGVSTGWDMVVLTDWLVQRLSALGWLEPIDTSAMTSYPANLEDIYKGQAWDPDNTVAAPYQSGMTGIGFDLTKTGDITSLDPLFTDQFAGRVIYQTEMQDTIGLAALKLGYDPATLTQEQFDASLEAVRTAIDSGIVRRVSGNSYVIDMASGDVVLAMAWSGDILTLLVPDQTDEQDFQWRLPDQGGLIWTDLMAIPKGAENKAQAETFIDWYYRPENAAAIAAWVNYVCPVKGAAEVMQTIDPELAANPLIFPTQEMRDRLHMFIVLPPEENDVWQQAYSAVIGL